MSARLPTPGGDDGPPPNDWGSILNDYLQQALASDGTLVSSATNSYTGSANTNLASGSQAGLVKLVGDLGSTAMSPTVTGLQGKAVATTTPTDSYVLTWSDSGNHWYPAPPPGGGSGLSQAQVMAISSMRV